MSKPCAASGIARLDLQSRAEALGEVHVSLRWRIALGFALVALATAAIVALATPAIVDQGFSELDNENNGAATTATSTAATSF